MNSSTSNQTRRIELNDTDKAFSARMALSTFLAALCIGWYGVDFTFFRDLTGEFTYFGSLPVHLVDGVFGAIAIAASVSMIIGMLRLGEACIRIGYVLAFAAYFIFAIGLLAKGLVIGSNPAVGLSSTAWFSSITPGLNYLLLAVWMLLSGLRGWTNHR